MYVCCVAKQNVAWLRTLDKFAATKPLANDAALSSTNAVGKVMEYRAATTAVSRNML